MTPKEQAIERLEKVLANVYIEKTKYIVPCVEGTPVTKLQAEAILNALNVEVVSRTEPYDKLDKSDVFIMPNPPEIIVVSRNNKSAVYVENIGG